MPPDNLPDHIAVIMDGNGRWAEARRRPRSLGHQEGVKAVRAIVEGCGKLGVPTLTLFAFSSENWNRPEKEVSRLMDLFVRALRKETDELHENGVRMRFVGELTAFSDELQRGMERVEHLTQHNDRLNLNICINYGGRWDIAHAARKAAELVKEGTLQPADITPETLAPFICLSELSPPDLLIRTGGEMRVSNFLLWQTAYTEMYFTPTLWPDFGENDLHNALSAYAGRERRYGRTSPKPVRQISA